MTLKDPFDGKEIIRFEDGRYVGEVQGDIRHGWGKYTLWGGGEYEGNFHLNKMQEGDLQVQEWRCIRGWVE